MSRARLIVTVDGPAGAGKSTTSRALARALDYVYLDTGAIYRSVALAVDADPGLAARIDAAGEVADLSAADQAALGEIAHSADVRFSDDGTRVWLAGEDVSDAIRRPEISQRASKVSAVPTVRAALLELQRRLGAEGGIVAEGRDVGTVVFPDAEVKFFLTADPKCRAKRRVHDLRERGSEADEASTLLDIQARDARDTGRAVAPLSCPEGAVGIDSTALAVQDVVARMVEIVSQRQRS